MASLDNKHALPAAWNAAETGFTGPATGNFLQQTIIEIFEEQVARTPAAIAVVFENVQLTYDELNRRANQLGRHLRSLGVETGDRVGICAERSIDMVVGLLGILKAGASYVPLDPKYPQERLNFMMQDAEVTILLAQAKFAKKTTAPESRLVLFEDEQFQIAQQSPENPVHRTTFDHPAYIIYTSGSTGRPKGVWISHRNAVRLVTGTNYADFSADQVFLQFASISFDPATFEIWGALLNGARLVIFPAYTPSAREFGEWLSCSDVTTLWLTAGLFHQIVEEDTGGYFRRMRQLLAGGDVLSLRVVKKFLTQYPECRLINGYGPTENGTFSTCGELREMPADAESAIIGRPIANSLACVLDADMEPVSDGQAGEIYLGGLGLAHGYWKQPALTAASFVPNPLSGAVGERLYRSGDMGRYLSDGNLEFLGRIDQQVKLRGYRIELGEIEAVLTEHPSVEQAVVVVREDYPGDKRLVAYVVPRSENHVPATEMRGYLGRKLPDYMVPSTFLFLQDLALTPNGKVDRRALPVPAADHSSFEQNYEAPFTATEKLLSTLWAEVLRIGRVSTQDNFFDLGGDSLLAGKVIARVHDASGVALPLRMLFEEPVLAGLARSLEAARRKSSENGAPRLGALPRGEEIPLGSSQERVWFLQQLDPLSIAYNFQATLRISGPLKIEALERSLTALVQRHEILRTTFIEKNGRPIQVIHEPFQVSLPVVRLEQIEKNRLEQITEQIVRAEVVKRFDVGELPLIRWILFSFGEHEHMLLHVEHHFVHDGWSFNVFLGDLLELYQAFASGGPSPLAPLRLQFADFAIWQQQYLQSHEVQEQLSYWNRKLSGILPVSELPADHARPRVQTFRGELLRILLPTELSRSLRAFGHQEETSLFAVMMSAFFAVTYLYTRQADFCVGSSMANRHRPGTENLLGMLVNNVVLRAQVSENISLRGLLAQVRDLTFEAYENQDAPFQEVVRNLNVNHDLSANPLFQTTFNFHNSPVLVPDIPELKLDLIEAVGNGAAKFDLGVIVVPATVQRLRLNPDWDKDAVLMLWEFNTDLFDPGTIRRMINHYQLVLESFVSGPQQRLADVCLLAEQERNQVLFEWNDTEVDYPCDANVHGLFEAQARRAPDAVAVVYRETELTYGELNRRANLLAHYLLGLGVHAGERVVTMVERSIDLVITELAILKCGAVYVPIDPAFPGERTAFMIADSQAKVVLCAAGRELPELPAVTRVYVDEIIRAEGAAGDPGIPVGGPAFAYIMYTSGSTGLPKGVIVSHQAINRLVVNNNYVRFDAGNRVAFVANPAFDATTMEVWGPLLNGGRAVIIDQAALFDPAQFGQALKRHSVNTLLLSVGLLNQYAETLAEDFARLRYLMVGGDVVDPRLVRRVLSGQSPQHLICAYGPTEATTLATTHVVTAVAENARSIPIGGPIANTRIYVLDEHCQPAPIGVPGELCVGGPGVAQGYLNRPGLTAERFLPDPFAGLPGVRMYKTGDLGRWLADGTIEFLGRNDFQVKVRGFRVELGEIEARLAAHVAVREAAVLAREDRAGDKRLVAYFTCGEAGDVRAEELRAHLAAELPEYMVPAAYVRMESLPMTTSGKLDRKALPAPEGDAYAVRGYEAPQDGLEATLASIWAEVLKLERVGRQDDFFALGGHSLLALRVVSKVRRILRVEVTIRDLFTQPTLAGLAGSLRNAPVAVLPPILRAERTERMPLSFAQQRMWFLSQIKDASQAYHVPIRLELRGLLNRPALLNALDRIVARHEILRTTFTQIDGDPTQRILGGPGSRFQLLEHDLRRLNEPMAELDRLMATETGAAFDLERGPLIRGRLIRQSEDQHVLLITMHHIIADEWSVGVLIQELSALYGAFLHGSGDPLPDLAVQYADYAVWQRQWMEGDILRQQANYWKSALEGAPALLDLPADHARPAQQNFAGGFMGLVLDERLTSGLKELSRRRGTTLFMTLLAGWAALLGRLSGQEEVVIGTPVTNRGRSEIEGLIGFLVNTLALRLDLSGGPTVAQLLERVKAQALAAQQHQEIPFEQVVELTRPVRNPAYSPLFQVMFVWQNRLESGFDLTGLEARLLESTGNRAAKFDLTLFLREADERIVGAVEYATALFEPETIERYCGYFRLLLEEMVSDDSAAVDRLRIVIDRELHRVLSEWNDTASEYPHGNCVHELFEEQVERSPNAVAVVHAGRELTYRELNGRANRLAHYLRKLGVKPDERVCVCVNRSLEMVVGIMAVLKAGGAYVPLDPAYPVERLRYMLEESVPAALITRGDVGGLFAGTMESLSVIDLAAADDPWKNEAETNPRRTAVALDPQHLAYVIYTSGSTGRPKGVAMPHEALLNLLCWQIGPPGLRAPQRTLQFAALGFDVAFQEIFSTLGCGGVLFLIDEELRFNPVEIARFIAAERIQRLFLPYVALQMIAEGMMSLRNAGAHVDFTLENIVTAGEQLRIDAKLTDLFEHLGGCRLENQYGPAETHVVSSFQLPMQTAHWPVLPPIGRPVANTQLYVLDVNGAPSPVGVAGELYIGGVPVARGYLNRADATAERFLPDPFSRVAGARMYRTGDLSRWQATGAIEFLGRNDFQIKIRGFRVELGEIEARLTEHPGVKDAVVVAREDTAGEKRLVAYYTARESSRQAAGADALRNYLAAALPEYMVPAAYVRMESLPLSANGKLNRKALPMPEGDAYAARGYEEPLGETECVLAKIWAELLHLERVGRRDNFFDLGGHSLLAVRVVSRIRQALNVEAAIVDLFAHPGLSGFAATLQGAAQSTLPPITRAQRGERIPLSFAQQRLWFLAQIEGVSRVYHIAMGLQLRGALDREALRHALDRIVARHEALRTTFTHIGGEPLQRIGAAEESRFHLLEFDLRGHEDAHRELPSLIEHETGAGFDLERGPLIRGRLIRQSEDRYALSITMHHIVSDGWSMGVFAEELSALYGTFVRGDQEQLPELSVQYADYAVWQRQWMEGELLQRQADYWKQTLAGAPALLELPADHARPAQQQHAGGFVELLLEDKLTAGLQELSRRRGTTLFMTLLAGWAALLGRLSGQEELVIGIPVANRGRSEIEGLIGFFVNTLALRLDLSGRPSVSELLERVKAQALAAQQHQDIPFEQVVELTRPVRSLAHSPLFQAMFAWQNTPPGRLELAGLEVGPLPGASQVVTKFDITLLLSQSEDKVSGGLQYAASLFEKPTMERYREYLRRLLQGMVAGEAQAADCLPLLSDPERHQLLYAWNDTRTEYSGDECVQELFEAQVNRNPDAVAVVCEGRGMSYLELNRNANRLAHYLRGIGVRPDGRVALCVDRGLEMMIGLLGILKAGGAYVPLDPAYPAERLQFMLADSAPVALLTQGHLAGSLPVKRENLPVIDLAAGAPPWNDQPETNPQRAMTGLTPHHLAYVIYTSGSTGMPKGVMIEHRNLSNYLRWSDHAYYRQTGSGSPAVHSIGFDGLVTTLFGPIIAGQTLTLLPQGAEMEALAQQCSSEIPSYTLIKVTPSHLKLLNPLLPADERRAPTRALMIGGEALVPADVLFWQRRFPGVRLVNHFGPTETTVGCCTHEIEEPVTDSHSIPIGRPIANTRIYILDAQKQPVPIGVAGEMYVAGAAVARGYLNRPELTAERFAEDPFVSDTKERMYRTGDLGRWLANGEIEFLGRNDFQVKIRGYRIELGEIEARLAEYPGIREAAVLVQEDMTGNRRLVAYYTCSGNPAESAIAAETLRGYMAGQVPEYMVPVAYVRMKSLPLTRNGKLDRKALPAPEGDAFAKREFEAPQGELEIRLALIWADVLRIEQVGRHDNFFDLGGHSLLVMRIISRVRSSLGVALPVRRLFEVPTLAGLAKAIEDLILEDIERMPETEAVRIVDHLGQNQ